MSNVNTYAIKICNYLQERSGYMLPTSVLLERCNIPFGLRPQVLKVLHKLHNIGVLDKFGRGAFKWELINQNWDRNAPLRTPPTRFMPEPVEPEPQLDEPEPQPTPTPETPPPDIANSYVIGELRGEISQLKHRCHELEQTAEATVKKIEISSPLKTIELTDKILPKVFQRTLELSQARRNILLVGPAGCGKTYLGKLVADALGLPFAALPCTSGMSEAHLLGRGIPNLTTGKNVYQQSRFIELYENGGVFLMDELDAADPNLLLAINSAIANGYCEIPRHSEPVANRHPNFIMIATANTFGRGATRTYAGRNQLDEATLDRFRIGTVECDYDETVERVLCPDELIRNTCQSIRRQIQSAGLRRIMSTRFIEDSYIMNQVAGWDKDKIVQTFFEGWGTEERNRIYI